MKKVAEKFIQKKLDAGDILPCEREVEDVGNGVFYSRLIDGRGYTQGNQIYLIVVRDGKIYFWTRCEIGDANWKHYARR